VARLDVDEVVAGAIVGDQAQVREQVERPLVDGLGDDRECLDIGPLRVEWPFAVLDVAELVPRRAGEATAGENLQREGWRRGLEPPTTGTTTRGSTN
jgi:hypothetical protein